MPIRKILREGQQPINRRAPVVARSHAPLAQRRAHLVLCAAVHKPTLRIWQTRASSRNLKRSRRSKLSLRTLVIIFLSRALVDRSRSYASAERFGARKLRATDKSR